MNSSTNEDRTNEILQNEKAAQEIAITQESKLREFKTFFYMMNGKPDTTTKIFTENVKVDRASIIELNSRLKEKLQLHYIEEGYIASITVTFDNKKTISFDCWETFEQYEWIESSYIKSIVLIWDFAVRLSDYENPQRHKLTVKISDGLKPEELLNLVLTGKIENMEELDTNQFPIVAQMDFINVQMCEEFINIVSEWVNSLEKASSEKNKAVLVLRKHRKLVTTILKIFTIVFAYCLGILIFDYKFYSYQIDKLGDLKYSQMIEMFNIFAVIAFLFVIIYKIADSVADNIANTLFMYSKHHIFDISKGDKNQQKKVKESDKKDVGSIMVKLILTLLFDVFCAIISTIIINLLGVQ